MLKAPGGSASKNAAAPNGASQSAASQNIPPQSSAQRNTDSDTSNVAPFDVFTTFRL